MVDIQSATAEIRRGKKRKIEERRKKKPQGKNIMSASATQGGHNDADVKGENWCESIPIIIRPYLCFWVTTVTTNGSPCATGPLFCL